MNIVRFLIIGFAVWLAVLVLRRLLKPGPRPDKTTTNASKNMVKCAQCGLHLPESEAIAHKGEYYCCQEHRRQHSAAP